MTHHIKHYKPGSPQHLNLGLISINIPIYCHVKFQKFLTKCTIDAVTEFNELIAVLKDSTAVKSISTDRMLITKKMACFCFVSLSSVKCALEPSSCFGYKN